MECLLPAAYVDVRWVRTRESRRAQRAGRQQIAGHVWDAARFPPGRLGWGYLLWGLGISSGPGV